MILNEDAKMFEASFTDPQGQNHNKAQVYVAQAIFTNNVNSVYRFDIVKDIQDGSNSEPEPDIEQTEESTLTCTVAYYTSKQAKDAGHYPYYLINTETADIEFHVLLDDEYMGLTALQAAEKYLQEQVLPSYGS